jgi:hypothetical protein
MKHRIKIKKKNKNENKNDCLSFSFFFHFSAISSTHNFHALYSQPLHIHFQFHCFRNKILVMQTKTNSITQLILDIFYLLHTTLYQYYYF